MRWRVLASALTLALGCSGLEEGPPPGGVDAGGEVDAPFPAALVVSPTTVNLGTMDLGFVSSAGPVTITNQGGTTSGPLTIVASSGLSFSGCDGVLGPGASCTLAITATPATAGAFAGTVAVSADPGAVTPLVISVRAIVGGCEWMTIAPTAIDLGTIQLGAPAPLATITVTTSCEIVDFLVTTSGTDAAIDQESTTCTAVLARGTSCIVAVKLVATTSGSKSDAVLISGLGLLKTVPITANVVDLGPGYGDGGSGTPAQDGGATWLCVCNEDADCCAGLSCLCGTCTRSCSADGCGGLGAQAECVTPAPAALVGRCDGTYFPYPTGGICTTTCAEDADCIAQGPALHCLGGACLAGAP